MENNNFKIDVNQLMGKIREEIGRHRSYDASVSSTSNITNSTSAVELSNIEALINNAESRSHVRTKWPDKFERFPFNISKKFQKLALKGVELLFRDQREVNFNFLQALRESLLFNQRLVEQISNLQAQVGVLDNRVNVMDERVGVLDNRINVMDERVGVLDNRVNVMDKRVGVLDNRINVMDERVGVLDNRVNAMDERVGVLDNRVNAMDKRVGVLDNRVNAMDKRVGVLDNRVNANQNQLQALVHKKQPFLDTFYVAFEDQFRGSRQEIIDRLKVYLPIIAEAKVGKQNSPILDLGCGRGEWLELIHQNGYTAQGIDINKAMVDQCLARKLKVIKGDAISYLQSLPDASLGAVTGFHIIEHLTFEMLIKLFDETVRVLKPGGLAIFETPNPQNIITSSYEFYFDPTHRKPLPSPMIKFFAELRGFCKVNILNLNPFPDNLKVCGEGNEIEKRFNEYFYGARDYAIVGFKL